jgi:hypothetical protein
MKLLLVLGSDDNYDAFTQTVAPLGFELIRYRHVLKAMDNIDEIDPAAIVISAREFPRHWKILVQFVRNERSKEVCPIIILKGESFSAEETSKAFFLGVNGVISDTLEREEEIYRLKNILGNHAPEQKQLFFVEPWNHIGLLIADLSGVSSFVIGDVKTISSNGLSFIPEAPPVKTAQPDKELKECSLRAGDAILSPVCRITGTEKNISLEFVSFPGDEQQTLDRYLEETFSK